MNKTAKSSASSDPSSTHCFPVLHETGPDACAENDSACEAFQPLYGHGMGNSDYRPSGIPAGDDRQKQNEDLAHRQQESYQKGIAAGQCDAECLMQKEMQPAIHSIKTALQHYGDGVEHVTRVSSTRIIELSLQIVHRILGDGPSIENLDPAVLQDHIADKLRQAYAIDLHMNSEDLEAITTLLENESPHAFKDCNVRLCADEGLHKGCVTLDKGTRELCAKDIAKNLTALSEPNPTT